MVGKSKILENITILVKDENYDKKYRGVDGDKSIQKCLQNFVKNKGWSKIDIYPNFRFFR